MHRSAADFRAECARDGLANCRQLECWMCGEQLDEGSDARDDMCPECAGEEGDHAS